MRTFLRGYKKWLVPLLLLWVVTIGFVQAYRETLTSDEAIHTASAYLAMTRADHRFDPEHPFLFKYLTALPFLVYHTHLPAADQALWSAAEPTFYDSWRESRTWADQWVYDSGNNPRVMQMLMRLPGIIVLVFLNWFAWWLARRWFGEKVALWALFFTAFNPTLLGHGFMTNTDVPLAFTYLLSIWRMGEYGLKPTRKNAVWLGVVVAIALLTKFSAIALIPVLLTWLIGVGMVRKQPWYLILADVGIIAACFWAFTWVIYFFRSPVVLRADDFSLADKGVFDLYGRHVNHLEVLVRWLPRLLPSAYVKGLIMTLGGGLSGRPTFLLGQTYSSGVWFYFPTLFALKNQLVVVVLTVVALLFALPRMIKPKQWQTYTWALVVAGAIFFGLAMKSKLNLGIRHISPIMPLLSLALAVTMVQLSKRVKGWFIPAAVITCTVVPILAQSGNLLGFGNVFAEPGPNEYHYFVDSNLDWGQSWQHLATVLRQEFPNQPVYMLYSSSALHYYAPENPQYSVFHAGSEGNGAIVIGAVDLVSDQLARYEQYQPAFVVDNAYFIYRTSGLVPK